MLGEALLFLVLSSFLPFSARIFLVIKQADGVSSAYKYRYSHI